jgi:hypothetical protein
MLNSFFFKIIISDFLFLTYVHYKTNISKPLTFLSFYTRLGIPKQILGSSRQIT